MPIQPSLRLAAVAAAAAVVVAAPLALAGCSAAPEQSVAAACETVRVQLTAMSGLVEGALTGVTDPDDADLEGALAAQLESSAAALGDGVTQPEVAAAYASARSAIDALADALAAADDSAASAAALAEQTAAVDTAGATLMTLCALPADDAGSTPAATHSRVRPSLGAPTELIEVPVSVAPGGSTRGVIPNGRGLTTPFTLAVDTASGSLFSPASWGRDYRLSFTVARSGNYSFVDLSGDRYALLVARTSSEHVLWYNSDRPTVVQVQYDAP